MRTQHRNPTVSLAQRLLAARLGSPAQVRASRDFWEAITNQLTHAEQRDLIERALGMLNKTLPECTASHAHLRTGATCECGFVAAPLDDDDVRAAADVSRDIAAVSLTSTELKDALTHAPLGCVSVPGDYIKLENQWARVMIQLSPYLDEPNVYTVTGDTKERGGFKTRAVVEAYRYALASLAAYARGRAA